MDMVNDVSARPSEGPTKISSIAKTAVSSSTSPKWIAVAALAVGAVAFVTSTICATTILSQLGDSSSSDAAASTLSTADAATIATDSDTVYVVEC